MDGISNLAMSSHNQKHITTGNNIQNVPPFGGSSLKANR
jgi:hypothetical protein